MKVLVMLTARAGATPADFQTPMGIEEEKLVWQYYTEGTLREMYFSLTDAQIAVVFIFEASTPSVVEPLIATFPFVKSGLLSVSMLRPLTPFTGLAALFDPKHVSAA